jgi:hypothetical protein
VDDLRDCLSPDRLGRETFTSSLKQRSCGEETSSEEQLEIFGLLLVAHRWLMGTEFGRCHSGISGNSLPHGPEPGTYANSSRRCRFTPSRSSFTRRSWSSSSLRAIGIRSAIRTRAGRPLRSSSPAGSGLPEGLCGSFGYSISFDGGYRDAKGSRAGRSFSIRFFGSARGLFFCFPGGGAADSSSPREAVRSGERTVIMKLADAREPSGRARTRP